MTKSNSLHLLGALFLVLTVGLAGTASATIVSFANSSPIVIPEAGKANPYPSSITVSGIIENVVDVDVTLSGLDHGYADDLYFVLKGPTGTAVVLWNDAGGNTALFGASVVFDDGAAFAIPDSGPVGSGSYQVSQYGSIPGTADTAPAPPFKDGDYLGVLGDFNNQGANGDWNLYAYDDANGDEGVLVDGWSLTFETQPIPEPTAAVLFAVGTFVVGGTLRRRRA
jgi:subtilisin-like proprotein convertase family protein